MSAKQRAIELIRKKEEDLGRGWSDDTEEIAMVMVEFQNETLAKIKKIIENGTPNRGKYKGWEERVFRFV